MMDHSHANTDDPRASSCATALAPGDLLGDYYLEQRLGAGTFGEVWKAVNTFSQQRVALKVGRGALAEALGREARTLGRLMEAAHDAACPPSIVRLLATHLHHAPPFLVMELVDGGDVRQLLAREHRLPPARVLEILMPVIEALEFAHRRGIAHRDLKPANILIGSDGRARLTDFGLGLHLQRAAEDGSIERSIAPSELAGASPEAVAGTREYMAPEQVEEPAKAGAAADIYALGVVMFEMLVGERPRGLTSPSRRNAHLSPAWDAIFERCYAHDPADRYANVTELRGALLDAFGKSHRDVLAPWMKAAGTARRPSVSVASMWGHGQGTRQSELPVPPPSANPALRAQTPQEKLKAYRGYGFFGWMLPAAVWCYLVALSVGKAHLNTAVPVLALVGQLAFVVVGCAAIYVYAACWSCCSGLWRSLVAMLLLVSLPAMAYTLLILVGAFGVISPLMAVGFHALLLRDVASKLRPERRVPWFASLQPGRRPAAQAVSSKH